MIIEIIVSLLLHKWWVYFVTVRKFSLTFPSDEGKYVARMKKNCCHSEGNAAEWNAKVLPKVTREVRNIK